jgi:hypothetical protein
LPAATILLMALQQAGYANVTAEVRLKFESAWSPSVLERLRIVAPDALIVTDLGSRSDPILPNLPTLLLDHHRPLGTPPGATLITAYRELGPEGNAREIPTTGLMAYRCAEALLPAQHEQYLWLAAIFSRTWVTRRLSRSLDWRRRSTVQGPFAISLPCSTRLGVRHEATLHRLLNSLESERPPSRYSPVQILI